jgi:hypothetical protein
VERSPAPRRAAAPRARRECIRHIALEARQVAAVACGAALERGARDAMEQRRHGGIERAAVADRARQPQVARGHVDHERGARERPQIARPLPDRCESARLEQVRQLVRDREICEPARADPDARALGIHRAPAEDAALHRLADVDRDAIELGEEPPHELESLDDASVVRRAGDVPRERPPTRAGGEVQRELLERDDHAPTPRPWWAGRTLRAGLVHGSRV